MILLFNVKITQYGLSHYDRASWLPVYDRVDIFKYCLASHASLNPLLSKAIFYIELAPEFADRKDELESYIRKLFPDNLTLHWQRCVYARDWQHLCEDNDVQDNDIVWYAGNDDHIFVDYNLDMVQASIDTLLNDSNPLSMVYQTHWPEQMRLAYHYNGELTADGNFIVRDWRTFDSTQILRGYRFKRYWYDRDWGDQEFTRTDTLWHIGFELTGPVYSPTREMVRHYDGYSHVGRLENIMPPLFVPPGFFESDMHIRIGFNDRIDNWTNFNPASQWLYAAQPVGADYRWVEEDIPLFWRERVKSTVTNSEVDPEQLKSARNAAFLASTRIPMHCYSITFTYQDAPPESFFTNHLR